MYQEYAIRPAGQQTLLNPGAVFDSFFAISGAGTSDYVTDIYHSSAGAYVSSYLLNDLTNRGLINQKHGPDLKFFPFYRDASIIRRSIKKFMHTFVSSYYKSDSHVKADCELQAWSLEAVSKALARDFPITIPDKGTLIDILTHLAFMSGLAHHILNTGELAHVSAILPLHPIALYSSPPLSKGITNIMPWLPNAKQALAGMDVFGNFNRPTFKDTNKTLVHMFNSEDLMSKTNGATRKAELLFRTEMQNFSGVVRARRFDEDGLCMGMPFIWKAADPGSIPFYFAV